MLDPSKVILSPQTMAALQSPIMAPKKRRKLREEAALEYLRSIPAGTPIYARDIGRAVGFASSGSMSAFARSLEKRGLVTVQRLPASYKAIYTVVADVKVTTPKKTAAEQVTERSGVTAQAAAKTLGDYAREFAWENNTDSLREFIKFMDGIELDLRRTLSGGGR